uniref:Uncharacterized protein n=1 Tax=Anguilla anguilla TaxID=7936 RepID=A0A0E9X6E0_ANGAN
MSSTRQLFALKRYPGTFSLCVHTLDSILLRLRVPTFHLVTKRLVVFISFWFCFSISAFLNFSSINPYFRQCML